MARRGRLVAVAALCSLAVTTAVVTVNGPHTAPNRTPLATGPGWRIDGASSIEGGSAGSAAATGDDQEWLAAGVVPGAGTRWASMVRFAMIDLHQLTRGDGAVAAGAAARWGYAWPRDMAFVAVAMARTGHRPDALRMLTFLQRVQAADGGFEARYRLDGSGPPDDRPRQSDGAGWALWAAGAGGGATPAAGLSNFATRWSGNSILYPAVEGAVERARLAPRAKAAYARWKAGRPGRPWMERPWPWFYPELFARLILAAGLGVSLVVIAIRIPDPVRAAGASLGAFLVVSPVLHPWYLLWVLPFAALARSAAFLYLSIASMFGYALLHPVAPFSPGVVLALEYGPFAGLLALDVFRRGRESPPGYEPPHRGLVGHGSQSEGR